MMPDRKNKDLCKTRWSSEPQGSCSLQRTDYTGRESERRTLQGEYRGGSGGRGPGLPALFQRWSCCSRSWPWSWPWSRRAWGQAEPGRVEGAASARPVVGTCGGVWPRVSWCCSGCGGRVPPADGVGVHSGALRLLTPFLPVTQGGDTLLRVMAVSALRCQLLFPEPLGHLRRLPRVLDLGLLRL